MKAIIIEEERFVEIRQIMEGQAKELKERRPANIPQDVWDSVIDSVHRSMNYTFVQWAQSHGASCVRGG